MTEILLRRGIALAWRYENPVLGPGEPGYETDTGRIKYGDGVTPWMQLKYFRTENQGEPGPPGQPGAPGSPGAPGEPGPPGPSGRINEIRRSYSSPSQIWLWEHGLGTRAIEPNCFEFDGITEKPALVEVLDQNTVRVEWYYPEIGQIQILY